MLLKGKMTWRVKYIITKIKSANAYTEKSDAHFQEHRLTNNALNTLEWLSVESGLGWGENKRNERQTLEE